MLVDTFDEVTGEYPSVHIVAHSLGAALALAIADVRSRRIASLTLIAPAGLGPEIDAQVLTGIVRASHPESLAPWLRRLTATPEGISDGYAQAAFLTRNDPALRACQAAMAEVVFRDGVQTFDLRPALSRLELPVQIIWGRQDHIFPSHQGINARGDFALHLIDGAGHIPQVECPDRVARIALQLVAAVEATV